MTPSRTLDDLGGAFAACRTLLLHQWMATAKQHFQIFAVSKEVLILARVGWNKREANTWNIMWKLWFDDSAFSGNSSCSCLYKLCTFALLLKWHEYYRMWVFLRRMEWLTAKSFVTVARTVSTSWSTSIRHSYLHWVISSEIWKNYKTKQDQHEALSH